MTEELNLVTDLAVILIAAGVFTVISKALKQPLILGYIVAGFIVSPHLGLLPSLTSTAAVEQWSEIGIIFLLFALGLEFSFKKLLKVGSKALITAGTNCIGMFIMGMATGSAMGWSMMESVFLGGLLSMSSTTIIIKAYDDLGLKQKPYAALIFGILVVEDLIAILLLVLLSTMAVAGKFAGGEMLWNLGKLLFFLVLWFVVGIFAIPTLLSKARRYLNDEIMLIIAVGMCFGMVALASAVGFSSALGAFVMGSILAETVEGEHIAKLLRGIKDLFGAIFFVSVGMMVDPVVIGQHWGSVLTITLVAMGGILLFSTIGSLLSGAGLDNSVHTGFSLAQLGEFSFIIASTGCALGVMREFIYPVIIAVSVITTFTTPYMIKAADPAVDWLKRKLPPDLIARISPQQDDSASSAAEQNTWKMLLRSYAVRVVLYGVVLIAVLLVSRTYLDRLILMVLPTLGETAVNWINLIITLTIMTPFLYGMAVNNGSISRYANKLLKEKDSNKWPILSMMVSRILIATGFIVAAILGNFHLAGWSMLVVIAAGIIFFLVAKMSFNRFSRLERLFIDNLNFKDEMERRSRPVTTSVSEKMSGKDVHIESITIDAESEFVGKSLREMPFRHTTGVNILKIRRGSINILIPSGDEVIYPYDTLLAVGTSEQIEAFSRMMNECRESHKAEPDPEFSVETVTLTQESFLTGKDLKTLKMRESRCMVISVLHSADGREEFITNPGPDFTFCPGDTVWIAGDKASCMFFKD